MRVFLFVLLTGSVLSAQSGYSSLSREAIITVAHLPEVLTESSGQLITSAGTFIGHNDSGNAPALYEYDTTGTLIRTIDISNQKNKDWEEMASSDSNLFIGDFGNNAGSREKLRILVIPWPASGGDTSMNAQRIDFSYAEQANFNRRNDHDFDCEAMIAVGDSLFLFTKNRGNFKTYLYNLPAVPVKHVISRVDSFDCDGLITAADKSDEVLVLTGYRYRRGRFYPFFWTFWDYDGSDFFAGKSRRVEIPIRRQIEAVTLGSDGWVWFTNEEEEGGSGKLYKVRLEDLMR